MQALEIRHFWGVASFNQSLVAHLDQFHRTTAQHGLFAEQIGFGFFTEIGFDDAGFAATICHGVTQGQITGFAALVLVDGHQMGNATALGVSRTHGVTRRFGRHHPHIQIGTGHHLVVMHIETVGKSQRSTLLHMGCHVVGVDLGNLLVWQQNHHHISGFDGVIDFHHIQASFANLVPRCATFAQTDHDFDAAVVQVLRMGVSL